MLLFAFFAFLLFYFSSVVRAASEWICVNLCINKLSEFIAEYTVERDNTPESSRLSLLRYYPEISRFVRYPDLTYGQSLSELFLNSSKIMNQIQMIRNEKRFSFIRSWNPIPAFCSLIQFPSWIVRLFGFHPGRGQSLALSAIGWLISYFLGMFQPDLKALILSIF